MTQQVSELSLTIATALQYEDEFRKEVVEALVNHLLTTRLGVVSDFIFI